MDSYTILVAEDDRVSAETLLLFLEKMGHEVVGLVSRGEEAVALAAELQPDIAILDIYLSHGMDGIEACRRITENSNIPCILLTGQSAGQVLEQVGESKAVCLIKKPVLYEELQANIHIAMRMWSISQQLKLQEASYRAYFNNAAVGIYRVSPDGAVETANQALASILGYESVEELLSLVKYAGVQYYVQEARFTELVEQLNNKDEVEGFESEVFGRDGQVLWVSESCRVVRNDDGSIAHYQCIVQDVSDRKRAEQDLQVTLDMLKRVVESIPDMVFLVDMDHTVILCNQSFSRHVGADPDDIIGRPVTESFPDFANFSVDPRSMAAATDPKSPNKAVHFSSGEKHYHMSVSPYADADGGAIGVVYVCREVFDSPLA